MKGKEKSMRIAVKDASYDLMEKLFEKHCGEKWTVIHHEDTNLQELLEIPTDGTMICITCRYIVQEKSFSYNISKVTRKVNKKTVYYFSILDHNTNEIISVVKDEDYNLNKKSIFGKLFDAALYGKTDSRFIEACEAILGKDYKVY